MNTLETLTVGATSLILGWSVFGRPIYNFYKSNKEKTEEGNYNQENAKSSEEYK